MKTVKTTFEKLSVGDKFVWDELYALSEGFYKTKIDASTYKINTVTEYCLPREIVFKIED